MAFNVRFYEFSKKENSTARPASDSGNEYACNLLRGSGVLSPVIELKLPLNKDPAAYNYAYIAAFERYYYVSEWTFEGALWRASMTVDALASWKGTIGKQSFYILRASAAKDGTIPDNMYPVKDTFNTAVVGGGRWFNPLSGSWATNGYFVVGILSYNTYTDAMGGINYYAMLPGSFNVLMQQMFKEDGQYSNAVKNVFDPIENYTNAQKANLLYICENPYSDYIKSVTWVPDAPLTGDVHNTIYLGKTAITGVNYRTINVRGTAHYESQITIPKHPLTNSRGSYVNLAPYTEYYLRLPKLGTVPVDPSYFASRDYLFVTLDIDPITGDGLFRLLTSNTSGIANAIEINRWYAPVGVSIAIVAGKEVGERAQALANLMALPVQAIQNPGAITSLPAAIGQVTKAFNTNGQTIGNNGGWLGLSGSNGIPYLTAVFRDIAADDNSHNGRPLCQVKTPASLGGYMMVQDADIQAAATSQELAAIKNYMESGFYYE